MDKAAIKTILSAYRAGRREEEDPVFAEALGEVEKDPELSSWFDDEQRFDARMVETLKGAAAPADLKELILLDARPAGSRTFAVVETAGGWTRRLAPWLAMAAVFMLAFVLGRLTLPPAAPPTVDGSNYGNRLALQAIAYTGRMPALQFVCFDASEVARWVDEKSVALHMGKLTAKPLRSMQMIGSSTAEWEGKPVVMVALQNGRQMAMLYFVRAADFPDAAGGKTEEIMEKDGYATKTSRSGDYIYVLTTKGTREDLDFPMPR